MKTLLIIVLSWASIINIHAADWVIHAYPSPAGNPWVGFSRVAPDGLSIQMVQFNYGTDPSFSIFLDGWLQSDFSTHSYFVYTNGTTLTWSGDWGTVAIDYSPVYGSISAINWFIEGGPPSFLGGSSSFGPETPGEYWIDWASDGTVRISSTQPSDFGKWAWDGSINPSWVEPFVKRGRGHLKH